MATRYASFQWGNANNAMLQQSAQFVEDTLVATGGWVVTSDTGQTLPSALVAPAVISTKAGYRIYRMNDALQATFPIYMRVDYGSSNNSASAFGLWLTFGTGSNGAGTITGAALSVLQVAQPQTIAAFMNCYGSAAPNRLCIGVNNANNFTYCFVLTIERSKDTSGNDTGDGLLLIYGPAGSGNNYNQLSCTKYVIMAGGTQPAEERGLAYVLTSLNPTQVFPPGDIGVGIIIHFKGVAQQPGTCMLICTSSDVSVDGQINTTLYGATRTYQHLGAVTQPSKRNSGYSDANARVLMRYD